MAIQHLLRTQWNEYPHTHATRTNFLVHLVTVPVFIAGSAAVLWGAATLSFSPCLLGLLAMMLAVAAQGWGHKQEARPPSPFTSRSNAFIRIFLEQWVTFPRYAAHVAWCAVSQRWWPTR